MFRLSPITLYLCGKSNIGKSYLLIKIVQELNSRIFNYADYNYAVFTKTVTTEHWDGYRQQPIIIFDDHYKQNDNENLIDARETMNVVSCTNYFPSFAHLELKGISVNSSFLIITSNYGYPQTIYQPEALHRRHKHHVIVIKTSDKHDLLFNHLRFYYAKQPIDLWSGAYTPPFTQNHDIPHSIEELNIFPFRNYYTQITFNELIMLIINDLRLEQAIFHQLAYSAKINN